LGISPWLAAISQNILVENTIFFKILKKNIVIASYAEEICDINLNGR